MNPNVTAVDYGTSIAYSGALGALSYPPYQSVQMKMCIFGQYHTVSPSRMPPCFLGGQCEIILIMGSNTVGVDTTEKLNTKETKSMSNIEVGDIVQATKDCRSAREGQQYEVVSGLGIGLRGDECCCIGSWVLVAKKGASMADTDGIPKKLSIMESVFADADDKLLIKAGLFEKGELTETGKKALAIINLKANKIALVELATNLLADSDK